MIILGTGTTFFTDPLATPERPGKWPIFKFPVQSIPIRKNTSP